jgi:putative two-component system response regulator
LKGADIPLQGRIMAIADVYDALVSERSYKTAFTHEEAVNAIAEGRGTQFDPKLVELFLTCKEKFEVIAAS